MNNSLKNFLENVNFNQYEKAKLLIKLVDYQKSWPSVAITKDKSKDGSKEIKVNNFSPLVLVALMQKSKGVDIIIEYWHDKPIIPEAIQALDEAIKKSNSATANYPIEQLQAAKRLIFDRAREYDVNKQLKYSADDKQLYQNDWQKQIDKAVSLSKLKEIYDEHINQDYMSHRRHKAFDAIRGGFGIFKQAYPKHKIGFIERLQNKAAELIEDEILTSERNVNEMATSLVKQASSILNSGIFSKLHYESGVKTTKRYEEIYKIAANQNNHHLHNFKPT